MSQTSFGGQREHGAVMVHVAIGLIAFLAFSALSIDYGVKWVARTQAQNAADAGALAGATALAFDSPSQAPDGVATRSARAYALANLVWGTPPDVEVTDITYPPCPPPDGDDPLSVGPFNCIRVDVYRNQARENPLPTYFSQLVGVTDQGVRAMAIAKLGEGNSVKCLLPFGVADRWADYYDNFIPPPGDPQYFANDGLGSTPGSTQEQAVAGWSMNDNFQAAQGDIYRSPIQYPDGTHTGWTTDPVAQGGDKGRQLILKFGAVGGLSSGWANKVNLPGSTGSNDYKDDIVNCNENPISIADFEQDCSGIVTHSTTDPNDALNGCVSSETGVSQGPTRAGVNELVAKDDVHWDPSAGDGGAVMANGCTPSSTDNCQRPNSPRVRPLVVFDINHYLAQGCNGTTCTTKVANIIGFFMEGMCNTVTLDAGTVCADPARDVVGRIVSLPGQYFAGGGNIADDAAFLKFVTLVR